MNAVGIDVSKGKSMVAALLFKKSAPLHLVLYILHYNISSYVFYQHNSIRYLLVMLFYKSCF